MSLPEAEQDLWVGTNPYHLPEWKMRKPPGDDDEYGDGGGDVGDEENDKDHVLWCFYLMFIFGRCRI